MLYLIPKAGACFENNVFWGSDILNISAETSFAVVLSRRSEAPFYCFLSFYYLHVIGYNNRFI